DEPGDTSGNNRYTRAAHYLQTWLRSGVLTRDGDPSMYLCAEEYLLPDATKREREGLIALCRLEPYARGIVLPHEETSPVPKRMLFDLRSTIEANLSQIFALYADETGKVREILHTQRQQSALLSFRDHDGMLHRVWAISEASCLREIQQTMADRWALIADGHHRYETFLEYQHQMRQRMTACTGEEWFNFAMMYLTDIHDPGLTILPTHRVVRGLPPALLSQIPDTFRGQWQCEALPLPPQADRRTQCQWLMQELGARGEHAHVLALYTGDDACWLLTYTGSLVGARAGGEVGDARLDRLDVSLLHDLLLKDLFGGEASEESIAFTQDEVAALDLVRQGAFQIALLVNPTHIEQVVQYALAGKRLPRKTTFFYPKLLTGIVLHKEVGDADYFS
ncbi:MAG: DUF1015 family protein, partial [Candidatus Entotheonellia bacterium]